VVLTTYGGYVIGRLLGCPLVVEQADPALPLGKLWFCLVWQSKAKPPAKLNNAQSKT
jgi:hypothetical protein